MPTREEIREGIDGIVKCWNDTTVSSEWHPLYGGASLSQDIILYLHSQGVVRKVGEEELEVVDTFGATYKTKCVAVEPLIEVKE